MAPSPNNKQAGSWNSPHDWLLMNLTMDLATLCDIYLEVKMAPVCPMDAICLFLVLTWPLCPPLLHDSPSPPSSTPIIKCPCGSYWQ